MKILLVLTTLLFISCGKEQEAKTDFKIDHQTNQSPVHQPPIQVGSDNTNGSTYEEPSNENTQDPPPATRPKIKMNFGYGYKFTIASGTFSKSTNKFDIMLNYQSDKNVIKNFPDSDSLLSCSAAAFTTINGKYPDKSIRNVKLLPVNWNSPSTWTAPLNKLITYDMNSFKYESGYLGIPYKDLVSISCEIVAKSDATISQKANYISTSAGYELSISAASYYKTFNKFALSMVYHGNESKTFSKSYEAVKCIVGGNNCVDDQFCWNEMLSETWDKPVYFGKISTVGINYDLNKLKTGDTYFKVKSVKKINCWIVPKNDATTGQSWKKDY